MFEDEVRFEDIMTRMLRDVPDKFDRREGSVLYTALAPAGVEFTKAYNKMAYILNQTFADTSNYENLIRRAKERGIEPFEPTKATLKAEFNVEVDIGSRFGVKDLTYIVLDHIEGNYYKVECEQAGTIGNSYFGNIVPLNYIDGMTTAKLVELLIPARDMENVEDFRRRYFDSFESEAFGGNVQDYKEKVSSLEGVGGVKVIPVWNGGGTVKIIIIDSELTTPSEYLVDEVQNILYPADSEGGKGYGIAPIGHDVTVVGANTETININANILLDTGQQWRLIKRNIIEKLENYITSLNNNWQNEENTVIRISQIESVILSVDGVIDINNTKLNGFTNNITLDVDTIAELGDLTNES